MIIRDAYTDFGYLRPQHHRDPEIDRRIDQLGERDVYFLLGVLDASAG
jgi:hypothetical protein